MSGTSPRLALPYLQPAQAQKHVTHNEALRQLDALVQMVVVRLDAQDPPEAPVTGDLFALGDAPTGAWAGQDRQIAVRDAGAWVFVAPQTGWRLWDLNTGRAYVFDGSGWQGEQPDFQNLDGVGIGATSDSTNRLAVAGDASLFNHAGAGHQLKINKATTADTASLVFQTGFDGRAEMGLAGEDAFSFKIRGAGGAWQEAIRLDPGAQEVTFASGAGSTARLGATALTVNVPLAGAAVQADSTDIAADKLMKTGAFGLGTPLSTSSTKPFSLYDGISGFMYNPSVSNAPADTPVPNDYHFGWTCAGNVSRAAQFLLNERGRSFMRVKSAGVTGSWIEYYTTHNIVGPVFDGQNGPGGAVLERGTTGDGAFLRMADGTQICWTTLTLTRDSAAECTGSWTFPAAFSGAPVCTGTLDRASSIATPPASDILGPQQTGLSATVADMAVVRITGGTDFAPGDTVTLSLTATGRWN